MRVVVGTFAMLVIVAALGSALDLHVTAAASAAHASPQFATSLIGLFAAICGSLIARKVYFAPIAMGAYGIFWGLSIYYAHRFRSDLTYFDVVSNNAFPIAISLLGVCIGALFGYQLSRLSAARNTAT